MKQDSSKLDKGTDYKSAPAGVFLSKNIGVYFSPDSMDFYDYHQDLIPDIEASQILTDTAQWTKVSGTYVADGNENFLNLGNFRHDTSSTFVLSNFGPLLPYTTFNFAAYFVELWVFLWGV